MPFLGPQSPGDIRSSSATLAQPFTDTTLAGGASTPFPDLYISNTFQQSLLIRQSAIGAGLVTVTVWMAYGIEFIPVESFVIGALNVSERRTYRQAARSMRVVFTAPGAGCVVIGSFGGMG